MDQEGKKSPRFEEASRKSFEALVRQHGLNGDKRFWASTFESLFDKLRRALQECPDLDGKSTQTGVLVLREVLQETAVAFMKAADQELVRLEMAKAKVPMLGIFYPVHVKDLWQLSPLVTSIAFENEDGRHCIPFPLGTSDHLEDGAVQPDARRIQLLHPRCFVTYCFETKLGGLKYLENEARELWADSVDIPARVNRRFSEFVDLRKYLTKKYRYRIGASSCVRLIAVPPLPPKASMSLVGSTNVMFVNERRRALNVWLKYVSLHRLISISAPFRRFVLLPVQAMHDGASMESRSIGSGSTRSTFHTPSNISFGSGRMSNPVLEANHREDPLVARRARQQIDEMLARFGSGSMALSAIHTIIPSLTTAHSAAKRAIQSVFGMERSLDNCFERLGEGLLRFTQIDEVGKDRLDGYQHADFLAMMARTLHRDVHSATYNASIEAQHNLKHTVRLWSNYIFPQMSRHVTYLAKADLAQRQDEEEHRAGATPSERLAAEWHEMSQVRCCMLVEAVEKLVTTQIVLAVERRKKWELLRDQLLALEGAETPRASGTFGAQREKEPSFADILQQTDLHSQRTAGHSELAIEAREESILEQQRLKAHRERHQLHVSTVPTPGLGKVEENEDEDDDDDDDGEEDGDGDENGGHQNENTQEQEKERLRTPPPVPKPCVPSRTPVTPVSPAPESPPDGLQPVAIKVTGPPVTISTRPVSSSLANSRSATEASSRRGTARTVRFAMDCTGGGKLEQNLEKPA